MKFTFDAVDLALRLKPLQALGASKGPGENLIGIGIKDGMMVAYGYSKGNYIRVVTACDVVEPGIVVVDRTRFMKLIEAIKEPATLTILPNNRVKITAVNSKAFFTLATTKIELPRPRVGENLPIYIDPVPFRDQLNLSLLQGELVSGAYKLTQTATDLTVMASDRTRLVVTKQRITDGIAREWSINQAAIRGVFEILKLSAGAVEVKADYNICTFKATRPEGSVEFGYSNIDTAFPDVTPLITGVVYPNSAQFETAQLLHAFSQADALAEDEIPWADFDFESPEACMMKISNADGSAEIGIDCPSEIGFEADKIIRLQLPHLKYILNQAKTCGAAWVHCSWGNGAPIRWEFDFEEAEDQKYANIDMIYITVPMNRSAATQA